MARLTAKRLFSLAWDAFTIVSAVGVASLLGVGTALDRAEHWVDKRLT